MEIIIALILLFIANMGFGIRNLLAYKRSTPIHAFFCVLQLTAAGGCVSAIFHVISVMQQ